MGQPSLSVSPMQLMRMVVIKKLILRPLALKLRNCLTAMLQTSIVKPELSLGVVIPSLLPAQEAYMVNESLSANELER